MRPPFLNRANLAAGLCIVALLVGLTALGEGPIAVQVKVERLPEVDTLSAAGFIVGAVHGNIATLYVGTDDIDRLREAGYEVILVTSPKASDAYPTHAEVVASLEGYAAAYPGLSCVVSLGTSVEGRQIKAILITDNPGVEEDEPEFAYISTMHGDEPVGTVLCMNLVDRLLTTYASDSRISELVDSTAIWIVPTMNPDGYEADTRFTAAGYDLNRNFPSYPDDFTGTIFDGTALLDEGRPTEAAHVMRWAAHNSLVLSANLHTGNLVVNYPYDDDGVSSGTDAPTPDDALFEDISLRYSQHNAPMYSSSYFSQGITNGAAWYVVDGGMQDWFYRYAGCPHVTLELSDTKAPGSDALATLWSQNEESMLYFMEAAHIGVRGVVTDAATGAPLYAKVTVAGNTQPVFTDPDVGDYHRLLLPGTYTLTFSADGYEDEVVEGVTVASGSATRVDVAFGEAASSGTTGEETETCPAEIAFEKQTQTLANLRAFRDKGLRRNILGACIVQAYYSASPYLAPPVAKSRFARQAFSFIATPFAVVGGWL